MQYFLKINTIGKGFKDIIVYNGVYYTYLAIRIFNSCFNHAANI